MTRDYGGVARGYSLCFPNRASRGPYEGGAWFPHVVGYGAPLQNIFGGITCRNSFLHQSGEFAETKVDDREAHH